MPPKSVERTTVVGEVNTTVRTLSSFAPRTLRGFSKRSGNLKLNHSFNASSFISGDVFFIFFSFLLLLNALSAIFAVDNNVNVLRFNATIFSMSNKQHLLLDFVIL